MKTERKKSFFVRKENLKKVLLSSPIRYPRKPSGLVPGAPEAFYQQLYADTSNPRVS